MPVIICEKCKKLSVKKRSDAKYCSELCRKHASLERIEARKKASSKIVIYEDEMRAKPICTERDLWILIGRLCKLNYECDCGDLLSELNFQRKADIEFWNFQHKFGITYADARKLHPRVQPGKSRSDHLEIISNFANMRYSL